MKNIGKIVILIVSFSLLLSAAASAKRPQKKESRYLTDIIQKAHELEEMGDTDSAEDMLLELYESVKSEKFREEHEWLAYMNVLRNLISFYYRQGNFKEADWYHREYSGELEEDPDETAMHAMIVNDIMGIAEDLISKDKYQKAEETFLYLIDRLEDRLGYRHWLVRLVYKNIIRLYLLMDKPNMAKEFTNKLNLED